MVWRATDPEGAESKKICWELVPYTRGLGVDIGCGATKAFDHFIGIDNRADSRMFGHQMNPDITVPDAADLGLLASDHYDFAFSSHVLEHIVDYKAALKEWWRLIKVGGHLCLYLPHKDYYPNVGTEGANPDHKHDFLPKDIIEAMKKIAPSWDLLQNQERNAKGCFNMEEYSFFQVFKKTDDGKQKQSWTSPKAKKKAAICRYGAIGDVIQTGSIAMALKSEGYHVTLYCDPRGYEIAKSDPSYDDFVIQDKDQVPNLQLGEFWPYVAKKYEKWVNLSESVEASLLALPDRMAGMWPVEARRVLMNHNYLEFSHVIAGTTYQWFKEGQRFVATEEEKAWAKAERAKIPHLAILWALAGSSVHKTWPWIDVTFARLMAATDATVITVGDASSKALEVFPPQLEKAVEEGRVWKRSGEWSIRQTLSFAQECDIVAGPETGVLNSVAFEKNVRKVVLLSHSSVTNLTRDWYNTVSLISINTSCYPCHRLHYGWETCRREAEGVAACQKDISPDQMWTALSGSIPVEHFTMPEKRTG